MAEYCPKCKMTEYGNYCPKCGTKLVELPRCQCKGKLYPSDKYCSTCGVKIGKR